MAGAEPEQKRIEVQIGCNKAIQSFCFNPIFTIPQHPTWCIYPHFHIVHVKTDSHSLQQGFVLVKSDVCVTRFNFPRPKNEVNLVTHSCFALGGAKDW